MLFVHIIKNKFTINLIFLINILEVINIAVRCSQWFFTVVASIGATPLPRHQPQKENHCDCYKRAVDSLIQLDISSAAPLEKPDFLRRRLRAATREGSGRGRLRGTGGSGVGVSADLTVVVPEVAGSGEGVVPRTTPSLAREERPESSRDLGSL